jgi:hypothetical protein
VFGSTNLDNISTKIASDINASADTSVSSLSNLITLVIIAAIIATAGGVAIAFFRSRQKQLDPQTQQQMNDFLAKKRAAMTGATTTTTIAKPASPPASASTPIVRNSP